MEQGQRESMFADTPSFTVLITLAPAFMCGAIYLTLSQTVQHLSAACSRFSPRVFYFVFIPCDLLSLALQATGGGVSAVTIGRNTAGVDFTLSGLGIQVITMTLFVGLSIDYAVRYAKFRKTLQSSTSTSSKEAHASEDNNSDDGEQQLETGSGADTDPLTRRFIIFVAFLVLAIVCIFIRCCYRIAELRAGYKGVLFRDEPTFIGLESVYVPPPPPPQIMFVFFF